MMLKAYVIVMLNLLDKVKGCDAALVKLRGKKNIYRDEFLKCANILIFAHMKVSPVLHYFSSKRLKFGRVFLKVAKI